MKKIILVFLLALTMIMPTPVSADMTGEILYTDFEEPKLFDASSESLTYLEQLVDVDALRAYLIEACWDCPEEVDIASFEIPYSSENVDALCDFIWYDIPELFQIDKIGILHGLSPQMRRLYLTYDFEKEAYQQMYQQSVENADALLEGIEGNDALSDVEKALLLHDRLAMHCDYDPVKAAPGHYPKKDYTMYGSLGDGIAVCEGFSLGYSYLLNRVGIENYYCTSELLNHGWNIVTIDGVKYHVDVTWDDATMYGMVKHDNFLRSTTGIISTNHVYNGQTDFDTSPDSTKYDNYYWQNSTTEFQWLNNQMYYVDNTNQKLMSVTNDQSTVLQDVSDRWYTPEGRYYIDNFTKLSSDESNLFYSLSKGVYSYNPVTKENKLVYQPASTNKKGWNIYGFKAKNDLFYLDIDQVPSDDAVNRAVYGEKYKYREKQLISAKIASKPTKLEYYIGDSFQSDGFAITERYSDGSSVTVTDGISFSGFDASKEGEQTITARHGDTELTFQVTVKQPGPVGDVDGNDNVGAGDALLVLRIAARLEECPAGVFRLADVNGDQTIDSGDALLILQKAARLIPKFPVE